MFKALPGNSERCWCRLWELCFKNQGQPLKKTYACIFENVFLEESYDLGWVHVLWSRCAFIHSNCFPSHHNGIWNPRYWSGTEKTAWGSALPNEKVQLQQDPMVPGSFNPSSRGNYKMYPGLSYICITGSYMSITHWWWVEYQREKMLTFNKRRSCPVVTTPINCIWL